MRPEIGLDGPVRVRRLPFSIDAGRLAFALVLAIVIYVFAVNETNPESTRRPDFSVPVEVVNAPPRLVVTGPVPAVQLRVRAPQDVFNRLRADDFLAQVDASSAREGDVELPVIVRSDEGDVRDVSAVPGRITVRFEELQERSLPVRVNTTGQVPAGYRVGTPRTDPPRVSVVGPASVTQRAFEALVDVSLERAAVTVNGAFTPRVVDERGSEVRNLTLRTTSVNVEVPVTQQAQFKTVGVRPNITGQPAPGYFLEPVEVDPPSATLVGEQAALQGVNVVETAPVDVSALTSSTVRRVPLLAPRNTILLQPEQTVDVTIRVAPLTITQTLRITPTIVNTPARLTLSGQIEPVQITLTGPAPTLSNLTARDLRLVLDLANASPGRVQVTPRVQNLPQGMSLDEVSPPSVTLELREVAPTPMPTPQPAQPAAALTTVG